MNTLLKNLRRLTALTSISATAMSAAAFAQGGTETVLAPGTRDGCPALELLNVVPLEVTDNQLVLPADINGKTRPFQFDTAAVTEQMTEAAAEALGLHPATPANGPQITGNIGQAFAMSATGGGKPPPTSYHPIIGSPLLPGAQIYDARGNGYSAIATVADFTMKTMQNRDVEFHISPLVPAGVDGVLSLAMFAGRFDIDLNFAAHRFNLFSKEHCNGKVLYWRAPGMAALPFLVRDNRMTARVMLEGKELTAVIDTGSPVTLLRFDAADRLFGIAPGDAGLALVGDNHANDRQNLYAHDFKSLSFGEVALANPHVLLTRGTMLVQGSNPNARTGSLLKNDATEAQPDMIIGMDMLKLVHLYIATRERMLYVTQGSELAPGDAAAQPVVPVSPFRP